MKPTSDAKVIFISTKVVYRIVVRISSWLYKKS